MKKIMIGTIITVTTKITAFIVLGYMALEVNNTFAQSKGQNEKMQLCWEYKGKDTMDTNRLLVNCIEFANSDYDTIEEFIEEEHPELKITK